MYLNRTCLHFVFCTRHGAPLGTNASVSSSPRSTWARRETSTSGRCRRWGKGRVIRAAPRQVYGRECPEPVAAPEQLRGMLSPHAFSDLESRSRAFPTPIQTHAIPIVFAGRDALVVADTRDLQYVVAFVAPILSLLHQRRAAEYVTDYSTAQEPPMGGSTRERSSSPTIQNGPT